VEEKAKVDATDPRVLFAAERTLLAWNRTSLSLMAFGFLIERFGFLVTGTAPVHDTFLQRGLPFWIGVAFVLLGIGIAITSFSQYRIIFRKLKTTEISDDFNLDTGLFVNAIAAVFGIALVVYLFGT
jgi:putative membrane protein